MSQPLTPPTQTPPARPNADAMPGPAGAPPDAAEGLALIKPSVRAQAAYTLSAPRAARKLNQNESPYDLPPEI